MQFDRTIQNKNMPTNSTIASWPQWGWNVRFCCHCVHLSMVRGSWEILLPDTADDMVCVACKTCPNVRSGQDRTSSKTDHQTTTFTLLQHEYTCMKDRKIIKW